MTEINWEEMLGGNFIKLVNGEAKTMVLKSWQPQTAFKDDAGNPKKGLVFEVTEEDGTACEKSWTVTAIRALVKLRPILEKAADSPVKVSVVRVGEGKSTQYNVQEV